MCVFGALSVVEVLRSSGSHRLEELSVIAYGSCEGVEDLMREAGGIDGNKQLAAISLDEPWCADRRRQSPRRSVDENDGSGVLAGVAGAARPTHGVTGSWRSSLAPRPDGRRVPRRGEALLFAHGAAGATRGSTVWPISGFGCERSGRRRRARRGASDLRTREGALRLWLWSRFGDLHPGRDSRLATGLTAS